MKLNELADNEGARKKLMRVGRGVGSGKGKTAGRGVKGQKSRRGVSINGFEGGQMPLHMRMPKRGFNNPFALKLVEVNLWRVAKAIEAGKLDAKQPIDGEALVKAGVIRRVKERTRMPVAAYNVSGEYAMIKAAAAAGLLDERAAVLEALTGIRRAGADIVITYHAKDVARWLQ